MRSMPGYLLPCVATFSLLAAGSPLSSIPVLSISQTSANDKHGLLTKRGETEIICGLYTSANYDDTAGENWSNLMEKGSENVHVDSGCNRVG